MSRAAADVLRSMGRYHRFVHPPLTIGPLRLATPLLLAPIAGYCDLSFRLVVRALGGVGLACTDLLCPEGVLRENYRSMVLAATCADDSPLCMQLYGSDARLLADAARWAEDHGAAVVDINMGCPVDKITKRDGGSKLLCDPDRTLKIVGRVRAALRCVPLTCKLRLGWDDRQIVAPHLAARLEDLGVAAITVHGRTTEMRFGGTVRLDDIAAVVSAVKRIPVIGNGDVRTPDDARRMIQRTGCAGIMIGRAALSTPWIFRDTAAFLAGDPVPRPPTVEEICALMTRHFELMVQHRGEWAAICEFRQRVTWYAKNMHPCRMLKDAMRTINTAQDFHRAVGEFLLCRQESAADQRRFDAEEAPSTAA
jgi:nifR3 family TIM-barrel protein